MRKHNAPLIKALLRLNAAAVVAAALGAALFGVHGAAQAKPVDEVFSEFTEALLHHEDPEIRKAAAHALGAAGGDDAYATLDRAGFLDWPMRRYDSERSGHTPMALEEELHLQWVLELPEQLVRFVSGSLQGDWAGGADLVPGLAALTLVEVCASAGRLDAQDQLGTPACTPMLVAASCWPNPSVLPTIVRKAAPSHPAKRRFKLLAASGYDPRRALEEVGSCVTTPLPHC